MRRLLAILLLSAPLWAQIQVGVLSPGASAPPPTTVTYVSSCHGNGAASSIACSSWGAAPTAGKQIVGVTWLPTSVNLTGVCDGTGTGGCTGSSTYTILTEYSNSPNFHSYVWYTCNYAGTAAGGDITLTYSGSASGSYTAAVSASGGTTTGTGCNDGYNKAQSTSATTAWQSGTVATSNANDLMVGLFSNACGVASFTAGQDGAGNTYTARVNDTNVVNVQTLAETATGTYYAAATGSSCQWNAEIFAIK